MTAIPPRTCRAKSHNATTPEPSRDGTDQPSSGLPGRLASHSLDLDQGHARVAGAMGEGEPTAGASVESRFPPSIAARAFRHALARYLAAMACVLALVLIGHALARHPQAGDLADLHVSSMAGSGSNHCPGPTGAGLSGHCHSSIQAHACCILLPASAPLVAPSPVGWRLHREPSAAGIVIAPVLRPPALFAA